MARGKISRRKWYELLGYTPRNGQRALDAAVDSGKRFVSLFAFPQAGKSFGAARHVGFDLIQPDCHGWIVAPTYEDGKKEFGYLWNDLHQTGYGQKATSRHQDVRGGNMQMVFPWGSWVQVVSADNEDNLRREQLDFIILAEASKLKDNVFDKHLAARLEIRQGKLLVPTTPKGYNWVYKAFREPSLEVKDKTFRYGPWVDNHRARIGGEPNPAYDPLYWSAIVSAAEEYGDILEPGVHRPESVERARRRMPTPLFAEQFGGDFASYAGLIYQFDPTLHECDPFPIPDHWTHVVGYDHGAGGGSDPTAIVFGSLSPAGVYYWWGEQYERQARSVAEHANGMRIRLGGKSLSALMRGGDAKQIGTELQQYGYFSAVPFDKSIDARIIRVTSLMREGKWKMFRGACPNGRREIGAYEWDENNPGKPRNHQEDHWLDAMGYACLSGLQPPVADAGDPDAVPGESPETARLWRGFRRQMREREETDERERVLGLLEDDPFEEEFVQDYAEVG